MSKALVNGLNIHYQIAGAGPDVSLIHGLTGDLSSWYTNFIPTLSKKYRALAYDLRGHGLSDMPPSGYTSSHLADELAGLLDHLGIARTFLVGHSYGGVIAMAFAAKYPERTRGVAFYDTGFSVLERFHDWENWDGWEKHRKAFDSVGIDRTTNIYDPQVLLEKLANISLPFGLRVGKMRKHRRLRKLVQETSAAYEFRAPADLSEKRLLSVVAPVLAIYGEGSPVRQVGEHLATHMPNCKSVFVPDVGHFEVLQRPEVFRDFVVKFLDELSVDNLPVREGARAVSARPG